MQLIKQFDLLVYRLFYWRWNKKLQDDARLRKMFIDYLTAWDAVDREPCMGIGVPPKYPESAEKISPAQMGKRIANSEKFVRDEIL